MYLGYIDNFDCSEVVIKQVIIFKIDFVNICIGPRLKTEGSYNFTSVRSFVRLFVRSCVRSSFLETAPTIFLKLGMK